MERYDEGVDAESSPVACADENSYPVNFERFYRRKRSSDALCDLHPVNDAEILAPKDCEKRRDRSFDNFDVGAGIWKAIKLRVADHTGYERD